MISDAARMSRTGVTAALVVGAPNFALAAAATAGDAAVLASIHFDGTDARHPNRVVQVRIGSVAIVRLERHSYIGSNGPTLHLHVWPLMRYHIPIVIPDQPWRP